MLRAPSVLPTQRCRGREERSVSQGEHEPKAKRRGICPRKAGTLSPSRPCRLTAPNSWGCGRCGHLVPAVHREPYTGVTTGAVGTFGVTTGAVRTFRPPKAHHPTCATERPQICGCLTGTSGAAEPASFQNREGNSREHTSACDLSDTRLQAQITHFTSDICCHGGRLERGCLKFN